MNTADRSILPLDTALRRRFDHVEIMPNPDHPLIPDSVAGIDLRKMVKAINARISLLLDRERQIGHTYLFNVKDIESLAAKFQTGILPLLVEYFYDDWSKIRHVLGGAGFRRRDAGTANTHPPWWTTACWIRTQPSARCFLRRQRSGGIRSSTGVYTTRAPQSVATSRRDENPDIGDDQS